MKKTPRPKRPDARKPAAPAAGRDAIAPPVPNRRRLRGRPEDSRLNHTAMLNLLEDLKSENEARKRSEQELREAETRFRMLFELSPDGIVILDPATMRPLEFNETAHRQLGYTREEFSRLSLAEIDASETPEEARRHIAGVQRDGRSDFETLQRTRQGEIRNVQVTAQVMDILGSPVYHCIWRDITERKRAEQERELTIELLRMANESRTTRDLVQSAVTFFRLRSGSEAVGVRLCEGGDYPYYEVHGFPEEFVRLEMRLCARDEAGAPLRDQAGDPVLDCMCGNVILGRVNPAKDFFTAHGSFWTNSTTRLLATTTEADRLARTRNRCNGEGYESVALIPLRVGEERLGLLQLNDRRSGRFTPETIALWERLAGTLAVALSKLRAEEALAESEKLYRSLFENMLNGFAYCQMHFEDDGRPRDFTYLSVNGAFEALTGLKNVVGRKVTEVIPGIRESDPGLFEIYGRVSRTGRPERFEILVAAMKMWFSVSVYSPERGYFVAVFEVITERKRAEEDLRASLREKETLLREIHHRVKNNMQVISSLFNLQAEHIRDEDALRILREGQTRIRSMALIHEKLYQSPDLSKIEFASYIKTLATHLFQFYKIEAPQVRLETDLENVNLDLNSAVPCGLLINELISNALKHAFPGGRQGVVGIRLRRRADGRVEIRIADDGVGFPRALDFQRASTFGLQIVNLLVSQLEGTISLDREPGTAFTVAFRELEYKKRL